MLSAAEAYAAKIIAVDTNSMRIMQTDSSQDAIISDSTEVLVGPVFHNMLSLFEPASHRSSKV